MSQVTQYDKFPQPKHISGPSYWNVLFNSAAQYPDNPTEEDKQDIISYIKNTVKRFTCANCVTNSLAFINNNPPTVYDKKSLVKWMCSLKNNANVHAGKPQINCDDFVNGSLGEECDSCNAVRPAAEAAAVTTVNKSLVTMPKLDANYLSVWNFQDRYPSLKKAMSYTGTTDIQPSVTQITTSPGVGSVPATVPVPTTNMNDLTSKYPSLSNFGLDLNDTGEPVVEELHGVLSALDNVYAVPAGWVGISPSQMNLAYTPEMLSNGISIVTQMYLTNAGSLLTSLLSSLSLIGISVVAKNNIANYDKLFIQNVAASLLFHTMNFLNPRIKDDVIPDLKKLFEGVMSLDTDKIKEALLFGDKDSSPKEGSTKHLLELMNAKNGAIDMKKLKDNPRDLRATHGNGLGGGGGSLTTDEFENMMSNGGPPSGGTPTNYNTLSDVHKKYDYILDNEFLNN